MSEQLIYIQAVPVISDCFLPGVLSGPDLSRLLLQHDILYHILTA